MYRRLLITVLLLVTWFTLPRCIAPIQSAQAQARKYHVIDGDSAWVLSRHPYEVRAVGYDSPEVNGRCAAERLLALEAKNRLAQLLADPRSTMSSVIVKNRFGDRVAKRDLYGRKLVYFRVNRVLVSKIMVRDGLARYYDGTTARKPWC